MIKQRRNLLKLAAITFLPMPSIAQAAISKQKTKLDIQNDDQFKAGLEKAIGFPVITVRQEEGMFTATFQNGEFSFGLHSNDAQEWYT